jgi:hypothetical protein
VRADPEPFSTTNRGKYKNPRYVVEIVYASGSIFLTSHSDITGLPGGGATVVNEVLQTFSAQSQRVFPDQGRSEIGSGEFSAVDKSLGITNALRSRLNAGTGPRLQVVKYWLGYKPETTAPVFAQFVLQQTQILSAGDTFDNGVFSFKTEDVTRYARKDIFDLALTNLTAAVSATDATFNVVSTAAFELMAHGSYYSDAPSSTVGYFKIKNEVVRYTGKTSTAFTGCSRGALGTIAAAYTVDTTLPTDRREKITEQVYLEEPAIKLAYALLTGILYGSANVLPTKWHLGIATGFVRSADFLSFSDLWKTTAETDAVIFRFNGLTKTDGKAFIEKEILLALGVFMPIYADGAMGLRRMSRTLASSASVLTLDQDGLVEVGPLEHAYTELANGVAINWSYLDKEAQRTTVYVDAQSISVHKAAPLKTLNFRGLHGSRHTDGVLRKAAARILDAYATPPVKLRVRALPSLNAIEVADVVRVKYSGNREYMADAGSTLDRAFMVQSVSIDHTSGELDLDLIGSTGSGRSLAPVIGYQLPTAFYTGRGTNLASVLTLTLVGSEYVIQADATLIGHADANNAAAEFYFDGNLANPFGRTLTIIDNVHLKIKGFFRQDGTIDGKGRGQAGAVDDGTGYTGDPYWTGTHAAGLAGYVGNTRGMDGLHIYQRSGNPVLQTLAPQLTQGKYQSAPVLELTYDTVNNVIKGLPTDLRGTSGGQGGKVLYQGAWRVAGGSGGASGAGLIITCRGLSLGASALIDLSGNDGSLPSSYGYDGKTYWPGAGAGGGPGTLQVLLDGDGISYPTLTGTFRAKVGTVPLPTSPAIQTFMPNTNYGRRNQNEQPFGGYLDPRLVSNIDLSYAALCVQYTPGVETVVTDAVDVPPAPTALTTEGWPSAIRVTLTQPQVDTWDLTEIWMASTNDRSLAAKMVSARVTEATIDVPANNTRYFWARNVLDGVVSDWYPLGSTSGVTGLAVAGDGVRLAASSGMRVIGNTAERTAGTPAWDQQVYSSDGFAGGCFVSFRAAQTNAAIMVGLNQDPTTDASYTSLDFAWFLTASGLLEIWESNVAVLTTGLSYSATSTLLEVRYDGAFVRYYKDGIVLRATYAPGKKFFLDSSFYHQNAKITDLQFLPLTGESSALPETVVFLDTFEHQSWQSFYADVGSGAGYAVTYPTDGQLGGRVLQAAGGQVWFEHGANIPFDPNATYRITARVRRTAAGGAALCYVGVAGVGSDGVTMINEAGANNHGSQHYNCLRGFDLSAVALNTWVDAVGYFKGNGTSGFGASVDYPLPTPLYTGVKYFRPLLILNYNNGTGTQQIDYIKIERLINADAADNSDQNRITPDAEFMRSTTKGAFWDWGDSGGTGAGTATLKATGGVIGGVLELVLGGKGWVVVPRRYPNARPMLTGERVRVRLRARRTTAITWSVGGGAYQFSIGVGLMSATQVPTVGWSGVGWLQDNDGSNWITDPATWPINQWQEFSMEGVLQNNPKSSSQLPYLAYDLTVGFAAAGDSGTIEIDTFEVVAAPKAQDIISQVVFTTSQNLTRNISNGKLTDYNSASPGTFTVQTDANGGHKPGDVMLVRQLGTGALSIAAAGGVTIRSPVGQTGTRTLTGQYARAGLIYETTNTWSLDGSLT